MEEVTGSEILAVLRDLDPYQFEEFVAALWELQGWDTEVTHASGDRGIDIIATRSFPFESTIHIQAKKYGSTTKVSGPEMQKYASLVHRPNVDMVIVVTTNSFTQQAVALAEEFNIKLIEKSTLLDLIREAGAVKLLSDYLDANTIPTIATQDTLSTQFDDSHTQNDALQPSSTVAEGEWLRIELVGAASVTETLTQYTITDQLDGVVLAFEITNVSDQRWEFSASHQIGSRGLRVFDENGYSSDAMYLQTVALGGTAIGNGWVWNETTIPANSRARVAACWDIDEGTQIRGIEYEEKVRKATDDPEQEFPTSDSFEQIRMHLQEPARELVSGLPDAIQNCFD